MRLVVLGGAGAGGNTDQGCAGYFLHQGQTRVVLDLGPGTLQQLRRHADFRDLDGLVISHLHVDHTLDLVALRYALAFNPIAPKRPLPIWMPPNGAAFLHRVGEAFADPGQGQSFFCDVFQINEYDPAETLIVGDLSLSFAPTVHYIPCWAIRVSANDQSGDLGYTADTGPAAELDGFFSDVAVLVAESNWVDPSDEPFHERGHHTGSEAAQLASRSGASRLVLTHWWEERDMDLCCRRARRIFRGPIDLARPGLSVET